MHVTSNQIIYRKSQSSDLDGSVDCCDESNCWEVAERPHWLNFLLFAVSVQELLLLQPQDTAHIEIIQARQSPTVNTGISEPHTTSSST